MQEYSENLLTNCGVYGIILDVQRVSDFAQKFNIMLNSAGGKYADTIQVPLRFFVLRKVWESFKI